MIISYTGFLGSGKTLGLVMDAFRYSLQAGGAPIWANFSLRLGIFEQHRLRNPHFKLGHLRTVDDIIRAVVEGGGVLLLDEVHRELDARLSMDRANIYLSEFIMFLRKIGLTTLYSTQDLVQIDKRLKAVTDIMVLAESFGPKGFKTYRYQKYHSRSGQLLQDTVMGSDQVQVFYSAYDTHEFTRKLNFPSSPKQFEEFMLRLEEAATFARRYEGDRSGAWEAFLSQSRHTQGQAAKSGPEVLPKGHVRKGKGRASGNRRRPGPVEQPELAPAAENGG